MIVSWRFAAVAILACVLLAVRHAFGWAIDWSALWENYRLLKLSALLLAVAVFAFFVMRGRKKRRAVPTKRQSLDELVPLRDDVAERVSASRLKWLEFKDRHWGALHDSVWRQIAARPNTWGVGLWPDAETEKIAERCARIFEGCTDGMTLNLIPEDPMSLIDALSDGLDLQDMCALMDIEYEFRCKLDGDCRGMTFGEFVAQVKATAGTQPPRDIKAERRGCLIALLKFVGLVAAFVALGVAADVIGKRNDLTFGVGFGTLVVCWLALLVAHIFVKSERVSRFLSLLALAAFSAMLVYCALPNLGLFD